ncbi:MlaD family protein [Pseudonocardia abyssalis]|uniref:MCE family protein n=1 Tax=Pseudonocardia abyssalis TaxID=2792008 RepID=A0ABS6URF6_9PSEU|nr:MlaD family protein [Pseudonocardia abyssalis]MBW0113744.1 MCE family protein [Pseudonocardia abyssalis]MBW0134817.1 MCE family protein [Pseudonocardia abyssalis]
MAGPRSGDTRALLVGVVVLAFFAVSLYSGINAHKGLPGADRTLVTAMFEDTGGLRPGDDVRIARARAGRVDDVQLVDGRSAVTLGFDGDRDIYRNATASVDSRSALGQRIVNVDPGTPDAGELGSDAIPVSQTVSSENLDSLFSLFDEPTRAAMASTLRETGGGLAGHGGDLQDILTTAPDLLPDLGTVSRALAEDEGRDLTAMLAAADRLSARFEGRQDQLASLTGQLATTLSAIDADGGEPLAQALDRAPATLREAREAMVALQPPLSDLDVAMADLRPGAEGLGASTPDLRGVLVESVPPLDRLPDVAEQAVPAVEALTTTMVDARPFAPRAAEALASANPFLTTLAPYAPDIGLFFTNWADALSRGDDGPGDPDSRHLRVTLIPHTESVTGQAGIEDPFVARNPYPAPGEAGEDSTGSLPVPSNGDN